MLDAQNTPPASPNQSHFWLNVLAAACTAGLIAEDAAQSLEARYAIGLIQGPELSTAIAKLIRQGGAAEKVVSELDRLFSPEDVIELRALCPDSSRTSCLSHRLGEPEGRAALIAFVCTHIGLRNLYVGVNPRLPEQAEGTPQTGDTFLAHADMEAHGALGGAGDEALGNAIEAVARGTTARTARKIADKEAALVYLCQRFVFIGQLNAFFDTEDRVLLNAEQFDRHPAVVAWIPVGPSGDKRATNQVLNRPGARHVSGLTYVPGEGAIVDAESERGVIEPHANTWLPSRVGRRTGVPSRWLELVHHVVPGQEYREWMLDWIAWILQNPGARAFTVPIICGGQGVGKDMMLGPIIEILGRHNARSVSVKMMESRFNGWMKSRLAIVSELKVSTGSRLYEQLKEWTGHQNRVSINEKFVKPYTIENRLMFFALSNHMDALEGLEADDRRWSIYITPAGKKPPTWYADMAKDLASRAELERVHEWLMTRNLTNFNPFEKAPDVGGHHRVAMAATLPTPAGWVCEQVCVGGMFVDREWLTIQELLDAARVCGDQQVSRGITPRGVAAGLKAAGCTNYGQVRVDGDRQRVWSGVRVGPVALAQRQKFAASKIRDAYEQERAAWADARGVKLALVANN